MVNAGRLSRQQAQKLRTYGVSQTGDGQAMAQFAVRFVLAAEPFVVHQMTMCASPAMSSAQACSCADAAKL